jgi:hypothetical protein
VKYEMKEGCATVSLSNKILLGIALPLASCSQDDRVATVTCEGIPGNLVTVSTELSRNGKQESSTGYLNQLGLPLGTIVRTRAHSTSPMAFIDGRTAISSAPDLSPSPAVVRSITIGDGFQVHLEDDVVALGRRAGVDLNSEILKHAVLYVGNGVVRSLPNLANSINGHAGMVEAIRKASPDEKFAVVSGTIAGDYIGLFSTFSTFRGITSDSLAIGTSYIHVSYSCLAVEELERRSWESDSLIPLVIYLTPIRYDETTSRIIPDSSSMESSQHE